MGNAHSWATEGGRGRFTDCCHQEGDLSVTPSHCLYRKDHSASCSGSAQLTCGVQDEKGRIVGRYKISFYEGLTLQRNPASSLLSLCPHFHSLSGPLTQATLFLAPHPLFSHPCCLPGSSILSHLSVRSIPQSGGLRDFPEEKTPQCVGDLSW